MSLPRSILAAASITFVLTACPGDDSPATTTGASSTGTTAVSSGSTATPPDDTGTTVAATGSGSTSGSTGADSTGSSGGSTGGSEGSSGTDAGSTGEASSGTTMGVVGSTGGSSSGGFGPLAIGDMCTDDADCMTGICWDFSDYDPFCFGTACSVSCMSDADCFAAMMAAGAPAPAGSSCGPDNRCTMLGTGFGLFACADQEPAEALPAVP